MAEPHDVNLTNWALTGLAAAVTAAFGWLHQRIARTEDRMNAADRDLWTAISDDRKQATAFRERTLERLGEMPTKGDLAAMEARLIDRLDRHPRT